MLMEEYFEDILMLMEEYFEDILILMEEYWSLPQDPVDAYLRLHKTNPPGPNSCFTFSYKALWNIFQHWRFQDLLWFWTSNFSDPVINCHY